MKKFQSLMFGLFLSSILTVNAQAFGPNPGAPSQGFKGILFCNQNTINFFVDSLNSSQGILVAPSATILEDESLSQYVSSSPVVVHMVSISHPSNNSLELNGKNGSTIKLTTLEQQGSTIIGELTQNYTVVSRANEGIKIDHRLETIHLDCKLMLPNPTGFSTGN